MESSVLKNKISVEKLDFYYGDSQALFDVNMQIPSERVTAFIGPSGCGKSTFLRTLNRMNDIIENTKLTGTIKIDGNNIYDKSTDVVLLRKKVGMIFQKSNPFPKSIFENIAFGPRIHGINDKRELMEIVEKSLR